MTTTTKTKTSSPLSRMMKRSEFTIGLVVVALFLFVLFTSDTFGSKYNLMNLTKQGAIVGVLAVAQTLIIITGGIAYNKSITDELTQKAGFIAPVTVYPGEDELLALVQGGLRVLNGEEKAMEY